MEPPQESAAFIPALGNIKCQIKKWFCVNKNIQCNSKCKVETAAINRKQK